MEVFDHLEEIFRFRAEQMQWRVAAATYPHTDKSGRRNIQSAISSYHQMKFHPGRRSDKQSRYDSMTDEERVMAVGSAMSAEGVGWLDRRSYQREWLVDKGISPEMAVARYTEWRTRVDGDKPDG
jgi:hypothetical protein